MSAATVAVAEKAIADAQEAAIERIRLAMYPGSVALSKTRGQHSPYWLDRQLDVDTVRLYWRDGGGNTGTQVCVLDGVSPETLARVYTAACDYTAALIRECDATIAASAAMSAGLVTAYGKVGK